MEILCECYRRYDGEPRYGCTGYCIGTKEGEPCTCGGIEACCSFYPEKREKAKAKRKMNTAEMWIKAQESGKMYRNIDLAYSKETGFVDFRDFRKRNVWPIDSVEAIDEIFSWDAWEEINAMTKEEAEAKLGCKIVG